MAYIARETVTSSIINAIFSIGFFVALFHSKTEWLFGGSSDLTMDFLPQALFVGLFAALPASLITAKRLEDGKIPLQPKANIFLPRSFFFRIISLTIGSFVLFGGGAVLLLSFQQPIALSFISALILKAVYGVLITICITPLALRAQLAFGKPSANEVRDTSLQASGE